MDHFISPVYFNIAYCMRKTLKELILGRGMLPISDFERLSGFQQLTDITVSKKVLRSLFDIGNLLKYTPQLQILDIWGFQLEVGQHGGNDDNNSNTSCISRLKIKELKLPSYAPTTDEEFLFLMKSCPSLKQLSMGGFINDSRHRRFAKHMIWPAAFVKDSWPTASVSADFMQQFISYILKIGEFDIIIDGASKESSSTNSLLSAYSHQVKKEDWNVGLTLGFASESLFDGEIQTQNLKYN